MANAPRMTREQEIELNEYAREDNQNFIDGQHQREQQILAQQDEQLDTLHDNVRTVHHLGLIIKDTIDDQADVIDELSDKVDKSDSKITKARKKINDVIQKSSNWKIGLVIGVLVVVLIVIVILICVL